MKVLFWGTPEFGIPTLEAIRSAGHELVGVVTNPDRPAGRGRSLRASPIKTWAIEADVPVLQPELPRGEPFLEELRALAPDISVVAAYGQILREEVLGLPPLGSINVHASLLPALRGAAPINWAIIRGHERGGATIMRMVLALDAGAIILQSAIPITEKTTAGSLYAETSEIGGPLLVEALAKLASGKANEIAQDDELATYAPKLDRDTARIDWARPAVEIDRWIRGCDPWPAAWTQHGDVRLQCFSPRLPIFAGGPSPDVPPGTILEAHDRRGLLVATGDDPIRIGEVKPAGRRRMTAADWIRGLEGLQGARLA